MIQTSLLALLLWAPSGDVATTGCNNLTRTLQQPAGTTPAVVTSCAQITVSVAGQSFSTPPSCIVAYTHYLESVYSCGPKAEGIHCKAHGYKATIKNYQNGSCPNVAGLASGMSWGSWADVPANLVAIIQGMSSCVPPTESETFDWSASTDNCTKTQVQSTTGDLPEPLARQAFLWFGDPGPLFARDQAQNPFASDYRLAMRSAGGVSNALLSAVEGAFPPLAAASLRGHVTVWHFDAGAKAPAHVQEVGLEAQLTARGAFALTETSEAQGEGETALVTHRTTFDGRLLATATAGAPLGNAYAPSHAALPQIWSVEVMPRLRPLALWLEDPFQIPGFADQVYVQESAGGLVTVTREVEGPRGLYSSKEYVVDTHSLPVPAVVSTRVLDENGGVWEASRFSSFAEIAPGVWRPMQVEHELFPDGEALGRRVLLRYRLEEAAPLGAARAAAIPARNPAPSAGWLVWL